MAPRTRRPAGGERPPARAAGRGRKVAGGESSSAKPRDAEVLAAAADVFARRGYAAATVQDVADALGILKGSIYYYIKSKEDLLARLVDEIHDEFDELLEGVAALEGMDPVERIAEYVRVHVEFNLRNSVRVSVYYNDLEHLGEANRKRILRRRRAHDDYITDMVLEAQREGLVDRDRDPRLLAYGVFAVMVWPYRWYTPRGRKRVGDIVEECVRFAVGGLVRP
ncbi:MAG: TetR/AcrR family transcriptional regulator [Conexibacter sp.]|nr:TetR/AcrR family transcriptional regulator [Conexibacter sp.]